MKKKKSKLSAKARHWLMSSLHTFITGFYITIVPFANNLTWGDIDKAVLIGLLMTGLRGGLKALGDYMAPAPKA